MTSHVYVPIPLKESVHILFAEFDKCMRCGMFPPTNLHVDTYISSITNTLRYWRYLFIKEGRMKHTEKPIYSKVEMLITRSVPQIVWEPSKCQFNEDGTVKENPYASPRKQIKLSGEEIHNRFNSIIDELKQNYRPYFTVRVTYMGETTETHHYTTRKARNKILALLPQPDGCTIEFLTMIHIIYDCLFTITYNGGYGRISQINPQWRRSCEISKMPDYRIMGDFPSFTVISAGEITPLDMV